MIPRFFAIYGKVKHFVQGFIFPQITLPFGVIEVIALHQVYKTFSLNIAKPLAEQVHCVKA
jgi:hypothetical protein